MYKLAVLERFPFSRLTRVSIGKRVNDEFLAQKEQLWGVRLLRIAKKKIYIKEGLP